MWPHALGTYAHLPAAEYSKLHMAVVPAGETCRTDKSKPVRITDEN